MMAESKTRSSSPAPKLTKRAVDGDSKETVPVTASKSSKLEGFAGTVNGSFFKAPLWVDSSKPAGATSHEDQIKSNPNFLKLITGEFLFFSPNFIWLCVALLDYFVFPYDLKAAKTWAWNWVLYRLAVNTVIVYGYAGFWHVTLYWLHWAKRPFNPNRTYRFSKVIHNVYYTTLGIVQWTIFEAIVMHCYATGRLPYISDEVPFYRELHFYFAHRLIHLKVLYKYVHSLHHRNTDVEPFAGLCMHPIEHLLYYACALPSIYILSSPFAFMWNGIHLLISPAASHSGYEDSFHSDQMHYLHHRFFECNYGTGTFPFDIWFGTYREKLDTKSGTYKGEHVESKDVKLDASAAASADARATLLGLPETDQAIYNLICCICFPVLVVLAICGDPVIRSLHIPHFMDNAQLLAFAVACGPPLVGATLLAFGTRNGFKNPKLTFLYPFHKEKLLGSFGFNTSIGIAVTVVPVYHLIQMLLSPPGEGIFFTVRKFALI